MMQLSYKEVWDTLSSVNVNDFKKKKGSLDYLSWSAAYMILMKYYPYAEYEFEPEEHLDNGSVMCHCTIRIGNLQRKMFLAVMDYQNKSIVNPTQQQIQNTRMRCLVKCIAMYGLGFYIYDGSSLPYQEEELPDEAKDLSEGQIASEPVAKFLWTKVGGQDVGADTAEDYLKLITPDLKNPANVMHKKAYDRNRDNIRSVYDSLDPKDPSAGRFEKLFELYEVTENE